MEGTPVRCRADNLPGVLVWIVEIHHALNHGEVQYGPFFLDGYGPEYKHSLRISRVLFIMVVNIATTRAINGDSTRGPTGASAPLDMSLAPSVPPP